MINAMPFRDQQEERPVCRCGKCGGEVYSGETVYRWGGMFICNDCFKDIIKEWVDSNPEQVAYSLIVEHKKAEE